MRTLTSMGDARISSGSVILVLVLTSRASSKAWDGTRGEPAETTSIGNSNEECHPGNRSDILDPRKVTQLEFHGSAVHCRSRDCLKQDTMSCRVEEWTAAGKPQVRCASTFDPKGFSFSYTEVQCEFEEKCIIKASCLLTYELAAPEGNGENHKRTSAKDTIVTTILVLWPLWICLCVIGKQLLYCRNDRVYGRSKGFPYRGILFGNYGDGWSGGPGWASGPRWGGGPGWAGGSGWGGGPGWAGGSGWGGGPGGAVGPALGEQGAAGGGESRTSDSSPST